MSCTFSFVKYNINLLYSFCCCCLAAQSCPTLCYPMDHSPPGSSAHGISLARILEWVTTFFFRESSQTRDRTHPYLKMVSCSEILIHRLPVERLVFLFASNWHSNLTGNIHWILLCFCWQVLDYLWQNLPTNFLVSKQKVKQAALRPNRRHTCYIRNTWIPPKSSPVNSGDVALVSHWDIVHL